MGRQLATLSKTGTSISYKYGSDGIRTEKTVNGVTTIYNVVGGVVTWEKTGNGTPIHYTYDSNGDLTSLETNGSSWFYVRNAQNDVIGLVDAATGNWAAQYVYDAWGKPLAILDGSGNDVSGNATHIANVNPYRYRVYRFDGETGLFYVGSRYYDPQIGRFINADDTDILDGGNDHMLENNLFAYCFNNPVNMTDDGGYWPSWATKVLIGAGAIVLGAAIIAATGGAGAAFIPALVAGTQAALTSAAIGAAVGAGASTVSHRVSTGSWKGAGKAALTGAINGAADGFMTGGIMAGASQALSGGFKVAANLGVKTGRNGGIQLAKNVKVLSPNNVNFREAGGTLLKLGTKASNIRFDVGAKSLFHMNAQFGTNIHVPIGTIGSGLYGGIGQWK
jgi:RHS repeat-associated protein